MTKPAIEEIIVAIAEYADYVYKSDLEPALTCRKASKEYKDKIRSMIKDYVNETKET